MFMLSVNEVVVFFDTDRSSSGAVWFPGREMGKVLTISSDYFVPSNTRLTSALQENGLVHFQHAESPGQKCGRMVKDISRIC